MDVPEIAEDMAVWFEENAEQLAFRLELKKDEDGYERLYWHGWEEGRNDMAVKLELVLKKEQTGETQIVSVKEIESQVAKTTTK